MNIVRDVINYFNKWRHKQLMKQLVEQSGFTLVNCSEFASDFHRYMPLGRMEEMLNEEKLAFVYPALWDDPFETTYLHTTIRNSKEYYPRKVYCLCARTSDDNEEASWKMYAKEGEPTIRVRFNFEKLVEKLKEYAKKKRCHIYYAKIEYLDYKNVRDIKDNRELQKKYLRGNYENKHICLMSLKRKSFEYEKEYRLFIVPQDDSNLNLNDDVLKVPIDASVFECFTINPMQRIKEEDENKLISKIKKDLYYSMRDIIKDFIGAKTSIHAKVTNSVLYKNEKPVDEIKID